MKPTPKKLPKKLHLASERIRTLTIDELRDAAGGWPLGSGTLACTKDPTSGHPSCANA